MLNVQRFGMLVLATALVSCGGAGEATGTASYVVTVSPSSLAIALGVTQTANAIVTRQLGANSLIDPNAAVTWTSSDQTIATVTASGGTASIKGVGHGTATITATSNSASGSTTITVTAPPCLITSTNPALAIGTATGTLGPADCRASGDNSKPASFYNLVVASNQMVQVDIASTAFTPEVKVYSPTLSLLDNGTGSKTRFMRALPPGTYTVAAGVAGGTGGAYSLTVSSTAVTTCAGYQAIAVLTTLPSSISSSLASTDCRLTGTTLPAAKFYKVILGSTQTITSTLASTAFSPRLDIFDSNDNFVAKADSAAVGQVRNVRSFTPGTYYVRVTGTDSNPLGAFTLSLSTTAAPGGALAQIVVYPDTVTVEVGTSNQIYAFGFDANSNSVAFTPLWSVNAGGGTINSSTGLFTAGSTTGRFFNSIKASSGSISGSATVVVIPTLPLCTSASAVSTIAPTAAATTQSGALTPTDCKLSDGAFYVKIYKLTVAATATVQIDLSSTFFDSYLYLLDSGLAKIEVNDDFVSTSRDSRISRSLTPGTYYIGVNSFRNGSTGAYTLTVKTVP